MYDVSLSHALPSEEHRASARSPETQMHKVTEARNNLMWKAVRDQVVPSKKTAKQVILEIAEAVRALCK
jgi:hypothetical protein